MPSGDEDGESTIFEVLRSDTARRPATAVARVSASGAAPGRSDRVGCVWGAVW